MLRIVFIILLFHCSHQISSQFSEDFDGGFSSEWVGDISSFEVNTQNQLQLNANVAGQSSLFHPVIFSDSLVWEIDLSLQFSPSNNNKIRIFLASSSADVNTSDAIVLEIGETGSNDAIKLIKIEDGLETALDTGILARVANSFNFKYKITKDIEDRWQLSSQNLDGSNSVTEWDDLHETKDMPLFSYFGFQCVYTSSNTDAFVFDNINIQPLVPDSKPPTVLNLRTVDLNKIILQLDESLDSLSAVNASNYLIQPETTISSIAYNDAELSIEIVTAEDMNACQAYTISIAGLSDLFNNVMVSEINFDFSIYEDLTPGDLLINEILSDPRGTGSDYVEIINPTTKAFNLKNLIIRNNDRDDESTILSDLIIAPSQIIVFTDEPINIILNYNPPLNASIVQNDIPGFNNTSGNVSLILEREDGTRIIIDEFDYNDNLHNPTISDTEGYSFERKNLTINTQSSSNWSSSVNSNSGTPGYANSISSESEQYNVRVLNKSELEITLLDQALISSILNNNNYSINGNVIVDVFNDIESNKKYVLSLAEELQSGIDYVLNVSNLFTDCGNPLPNLSFNLRLIEQATIGDLLINEILFDPYVGGEDFVELINNSSKYLSLENIEISNSQNGDSDFISYNEPLEPGQIIAFTKNVNDLTEIYLPPDTALIISQNIPAFNNDEGNITIKAYDPSGASTVIDSFNYSESMHYSLLRDTEGVSLERISVTNTSNNPDNWYSSSQTNNFATPGYKNSANTEGNTANQDIIELPHTTFSPDNDGYKDFLIINYTLEKNGFLANINIYNDLGTKVFELANNLLLSNNGFLRWDGESLNNDPLPLGIYIIHYTLFHPDGESYEGKKACVLAYDLNED